MTLNISNGKFFISNENSLWKGSNLYELYKIAYTPWEWHGPIMQRAKDAQNVRYLQAPLAYPDERRQRLGTQSTKRPNELQAQERRRRVAR